MGKYISWTVHVHLYVASVFRDIVEMNNHLEMMPSIIGPMAVKFQIYRGSPQMEVVTLTY